MKTIGIIGGLGPATTAKFYLELTNLCQTKNKIHRPEILICSVPLPYKIEKDAITQGKGEERCVPFLIDAAKKLEKAGANFLVMPCNSLHAFINDIRKATTIPVLSIVEETVKYLKQKKIKKVGIISTAITINKKLYEESLATNNVRQILPNDYQQTKIGELIHNLVMDKHGNKDRQELMKIVNDFATKKVEHVILACTDLQLLLASHSKLQIYDTMKIFATAAAKEILK